MPRLLIAGCGYVGRAAAELFHKAGWEVEGWTHSAESAAQLANQPYPVRAVDITEGSAVASAARPFDVVIHCASSGGGGPEGYRKVYLEGARHLLAELSPDRFLYTSSTSVYAQRDGEWVDEESAAAPSHETGRILRETEDLVRQKGGVVLRLAGIYGPDRSALLRRFLAGEARLDGEGERFFNHAHRDDIASALRHVATLPAADWKNAGIVNVADDEPLTQREAYEWLSTRLDRPMPPSATQPAQRKRGSSNKRVSNRKLRELGWKPEFPNLPAGMEKSVLPASPDFGAYL